MPSSILHHYFCICATTSIGKKQTHQKKPAPFFYNNRQQGRNCTDAENELWYV